MVGTGIFMKKLKCSGTNMAETLIHDTVQRTTNMWLEPAHAIVLLPYVKRPAPELSEQPAGVDYLLIYVTHLFSVLVKYKLKNIEQYTELNKLEMLDVHSIDPEAIEGI